MRRHLTERIRQVSGLGPLFGGLIGEAEYFDAATSDTDKIQALLEFAAWCVSEGDQAGTIAGKLSVVLHFHRVILHMELPTSSPLIKRALKGVAPVSYTHLTLPTIYSV